MTHSKLLTILTVFYVLFYGALLANFVVVNISNPKKLYESEAFSLVSITNALSVLVLLIRFLTTKHSLVFAILGLVGGILVAAHHLLVMYGATQSFGFFPMIFFGFGPINFIGLLLGLAILYQSFYTLFRSRGLSG